MLDIEDPAQLLDYLRSSGRVNSQASIESTPLTGGVSCRTVLVRTSVGSCFVMKQALELLRVDEVWEGDPCRSEREAEGMRVLGEILGHDRIPELIFEDADEHVIALSAVEQPHENWKSVLLRGDIDNKRWSSSHRCSAPCTRSRAVVDANSSRDSPTTRSSSPFVSTRTIATP